MHRDYESRVSSMDAEWLLQNHEEHIALEAALSQRLLQLGHLHEGRGIIESLQLPGLAIRPSTQTDHRESPVDSAVALYPEALRQEALEEEREIRRLKMHLMIAHDYNMIYEAVIAGLTAEERRLIEDYYIHHRSLESLAAEADANGNILSKSTIRRRRIQIIAKAQRILDILLLAK